jgi:hypothetical protein
VALQLILGGSGSPIGFTNSLLHPRMLDFMSTTSDHTPVISIRFSFIFGVMTGLIRCLSVTPPTNNSWFGGITN